MLTIIHSQKATTKKEPKEIPYTFSKTLLKMRKPRTKKTPKKEQRANAAATANSRKVKAAVAIEGLHADVATVQVQHK